MLLLNVALSSYCDKIYQCMTSTQEPAEYTMTQHTRAGRNMQPSSKSEKLIKVNAT